jgi:hypothetical protein
LLLTTRPPTTTATPRRSRHLLVTSTQSLTPTTRPTPKSFQRKPMTAPPQPSSSTTRQPATPSTTRGAFGETTAIPDSSEMLRSRGCHLNGGNAFWTQQGLMIPPQEAQQSPNQLRSHTECSQSVHSLRLSLLSPAKNKRLCIDRLEGLGFGLRPSSTTETSESSMANGSIRSIDTQGLRSTLRTNGT